MIGNTDRAGQGPAALYLVDGHALRRACMLNVLTPAALMAAVVAFGSVEELLAAAAGRDFEPGVILLSLGSLSLSAAGVQAALGRLRAGLPGAPLALLSDRDEAAEVAAAHRLGARGFVPTSLEPEAALQALRTVLAGGVFYPPPAHRRLPRSRPGRGRSRFPTDGGPTRH